MEDSQARWSDLPPQLWPVIGQHLKTYLDIVRFRSVCRSWRDSLPKLKAICPKSDFLVSDLKNQEAVLFFHSPMDQIVVLQRIFYRFSPLHHRHQSSDWLAMIDTTTNLNDIPIYSDSAECHRKKEVNFLDFRIQPVAKSYLTGVANTTSQPLINKLAVLFTSDSNFIIVAIQYLGKLVFRNNNKYWNWKRISHEDAEYEDLIVYNHQIHTVDKQGRVFSIDSTTMELVQISPPMSVWSDLKHLVECGGELYVVDRYRDKKADGGASVPDWFVVHCWCSGLSKAKSVDFKVHRLDRERGRWVEVDDLGNQAFVLGMVCFSVQAASDLEGFEGNCIYFAHQPNLDLSHGYGYTNYVFHLHKRTILKSSVRIFKGCPVSQD